MIEQNFSLHYGGEIEENVWEVLGEVCCKLWEVEQGRADGSQHVCQLLPHCKHIFIPHKVWQENLGTCIETRHGKHSHNKAGNSCNSCILSM